MADMTKLPDGNYEYMGVSIVRRFESLCPHRRVLNTQQGWTVQLYEKTWFPSLKRVKQFLDDFRGRWERGELDAVERKKNGWYLGQLWGQKNEAQ